MKIIVSAAAVALLITAARTGYASDLSFAFQLLETANPSTGSPAPTTPQPPAAAPSRLLLGAWLTDVEGNLQVSETLPGSPAAQTLQPGDVLCRITATGRSRTLRTLHQFEYAKREIGPNRQSVLDVYRPGVGMIPMHVTFAAAPGGLAEIAYIRPQPNDPAAAAERQGLVRR